MNQRFWQDDVACRQGEMTHLEMKHVSGSIMLMGIFSSEREGDRDSGCSGLKTGALVHLYRLADSTKDRGVE